jgi:hypothetical protein
VLQRFLCSFAAVAKVLGSWFLALGLGAWFGIGSGVLPARGGCERVADRVDGGGWTPRRTAYAPQAALVFEKRASRSTRRRGGRENARTRVRSGRGRTGCGEEGISSNAGRRAAAAVAQECSACEGYAGESMRTTSTRKDGYPGEDIARIVGVRVENLSRQVIRRGGGAGLVPGTFSAPARQAHRRRVRPAHRRQRAVLSCRRRYALVNEDAGCRAPSGHRNHIP